VSLLDSLLWGRGLEKVLPKSSPTSPSSPAGATTGVGVWPPACSWNDLGDPYGRRANFALERIYETPAPKGLTVWLCEHSPFLYRKLTRDLPDKISRAWDARISYQAFDALCFELVDTYRRAAELYGARHPARKLEKLP
jgi:hypothetical protein